MGRYSPTVGDGSKVIIEDSTVSMVDTGTELSVNAILIHNGATAGADFSFRIVRSSVGVSCARECVAIYQLGLRSAGERFLLSIEDSTVSAIARTSGRAAAFKLRGFFVIPSDGVVRVERSTLSARAPGDAHGWQFSSTIGFRSRAWMSLAGTNITTHSTGAIAHGLSSIGTLIFLPESNLTVTDSHISTTTDADGQTAIGIELKTDLRENVSVWVSRSVITATATSSSAPTGIRLRGFSARANSVVSITDSSVVASVSTPAQCCGRALYVTGSTFAENFTFTIARSNITATAPTNAAALFLDNSATFGVNAHVTINASKMIATANVKAFSFHTAASFGLNAKFDVADSQLRSSATVDSGTLLIQGSPALTTAAITLSSSTFEFDASATSQEFPIAAFGCDSDTTWDGVSLTVSDSSFLSIAAAGAAVGPTAAFVRWPKTITGASLQYFKDVTFSSSPSPPSPGAEVPVFVITSGGSGPSVWAPLWLCNVRADGVAVTTGPAAFTEASGFVCPATSMTKSSTRSKSLPPIPRTRTQSSTPTSFATVSPSTALTATMSLSVSRARTQSNSVTTQERDLSVTSSAAVTGTVSPVNSVSASNPNATNTVSSTLSIIASATVTQSANSKSSTIPISLSQTISRPTMTLSRAVTISRTPVLSDTMTRSQTLARTVTLSMSRSMIVTASVTTALTHGSLTTTKTHTAPSKTITRFASATRTNVLSQSTSKSAVLSRTGGTMTPTAAVSRSISSTSSVSFMTATRNATMSSSISLSPGRTVSTSVLISATSSSTASIGSATRTHPLTKTRSGVVTMSATMAVTASLSPSTSLGKPTPTASHLASPTQLQTASARVTPGTTTFTTSASSNRTISKERSMSAPVLPTSSDTLTVSARVSTTATEGPASRSSTAALSRTKSDDQTMSQQRSISSSVIATISDSLTTIPTLSERATPTVSKETVSGSSTSAITGTKSDGQTNTQRINQTSTVRETATPTASMSQSSARRHARTTLHIRSGSECMMDFTRRTTTIDVLVVSPKEFSIIVNTSGAVESLFLNATLTVRRPLSVRHDSASPAPEKTTGETSNVDTGFEDVSAGTFVAVTNAVPIFDEFGRRNSTVLSLVFNDTVIQELGLVTRSRYSNTSATKQNVKDLNITRLGNYGVRVQSSPSGFGITEQVTVTLLDKELLHDEVTTLIARDGLSHDAATLAANRSLFVSSTTGSCVLPAVRTQFRSTVATSGAFALMHNYNTDVALSRGFGSTDRMKEGSTAEDGSQSAASTPLLHSIQPSPITGLRVLAYVDLQKTGLPLTLRSRTLEAESDQPHNARRSTEARRATEARHDLEHPRVEKAAVATLALAGMVCRFDTKNVSLSCFTEVPLNTTTALNLPLEVEGLSSTLPLAALPTVTARVHVWSTNAAPVEMEIQFTTSAQDQPLASPSPGQPTPSPPVVEITTGGRLGGVFALTGRCEGQVNIVLVTAVLGLVVVGLRVAWSAVQRRREAKLIAEIESEAKSAVVRNFSFSAFPNGMTEQGHSSFAGSSGLVQGHSQNGVKNAHDRPSDDAVAADGAPILPRTHGVSRAAYLLRCHQWVAFVFPDHHYAGAPHAVIFFARVFVMFAVVAALVSEYFQLVRSANAAAAVIALVGATTAGAVQPVLRVFFYISTEIDHRGRKKGAPVFGPSPQDLLIFGVPKKPFIGVNKDTFVGLDDVDFRASVENLCAAAGEEQQPSRPNAANESTSDSNNGDDVGLQPQEQEPAQPPTATPFDLQDSQMNASVPSMSNTSFARSGSRRQSSGKWAAYMRSNNNSIISTTDMSSPRADQSPRVGQDVPNSGGDIPHTTAPRRGGYVTNSSMILAANPRESRRGTPDPLTFDPATCVRTRTSRYVFCGYLVNAFVAIPAAVVAGALTAPWCASVTYTFWLCSGLALVADAFAVQPLIVLLCMLYHWIVRDSSSDASAHDSAHQRHETIKTSGRETSSNGETASGAPLSLTSMPTTTKSTEDPSTGKGLMTNVNKTNADDGGVSFDLMPIDGSWRYVGPAVEKVAPRLPWSNGSARPSPSTAPVNFSFAGSTASTAAEAATAADAAAGADLDIDNLRSINKNAGCMHHNEEEAQSFGEQQPVNPVTL